MAFLSNFPPLGLWSGSHCSLTFDFFKSSCHSSREVYNSGLKELKTALDKMKSKRPTVGTERKNSYFTFTRSWQTLSAERSPQQSLTAVPAIT
jgi:hypothetical protein